MSDVKRVVKIVFSPTGGTEKVADIIAREWDEDPQCIRLDRPNEEYSKEIDTDSIAVIAMPSFGGRAPEAAIERLRQLNGNDASCVLVCVYGNRAWEDTLVEMEDAAEEAGFSVGAAIAAVAQHSILPQYAAGRPDEADEEQLREFAEKIAYSDGMTCRIPGNRPYKKAGAVPLVPKHTRGCTKCGKCAEECPVGAIETESFRTDSKTCISCMSCVSKCPSHARKVNNLMVSAAAMSLKKACAERKDNELFL